MEEKDKWLEDLHLSVNTAKAGEEPVKVQYPSLKSNSE